MSHPVDAAFVAIRKRLTTGSELWGTRVAQGFAESGVAYPYVVMFPLSGGEANRVRARDAELSMAVKVVSDTYAHVSAGAERLNDLLNDRGLHDGAGEVTVTGWLVLSITEGQAIYLKELVDGRAVYHMGAAYIITMTEA